MLKVMNQMFSLSGVNLCATVFQTIKKILPIMKLCLKQMSNKELLIEHRKQAWGFDYGAQLWKFINQARESSNTPRGCKTSVLERKIGRDRVWDKQGSETGMKNRLQTDGHTCRWNRPDQGHKKLGNSHDRGRKIVRKLRSHKQRIKHDKSHKISHRSNWGHSRSRDKHDLDFWST